MLQKPHCIAVRLEGLREWSQPQTCYRHAWYSDNAAVLWSVFGPDDLDTSTPCFHLIKRVHQKNSQPPVKWIGKKVKAHQDDDTAYEPGQLGES